ncbi:MAG: DUF4468 domain-containing protein [Bacteroidetes bacterium]|nr:DUF4468 domain-containing protein [Bacteroidota bacterium]
MKKVIMLSVLCFAMLAQGCAMITTKSIPVEKIVKIENTKKNTLYVRANNWMVESFNNAKSVIQFTDKESGTISGRYLLGTVTNANEYGPARYAYANIKIQVKDNASKITIKPESFTYAKGNMYTLYTEKEAQRDINSLLASFEDSMQKVENSDW